MDEEPTCEPAASDDTEARRQRAAELHAEIERLKSGESEREPGEPERPPSPRELTDRNVREELEREPSERVDDPENAEVERA